MLRRLVPLALLLCATAAALAAPVDSRLIARGRDAGALPTVRFEAEALRAAAQRQGRFRILEMPLRRDLAVELELERFHVTRADTRFVLGRRDGPDVVLDFDPSQVALFRGEVVGRPGSRVVLVLRDGHHTGSIDLGPGAARYWISSRGPRGEVLEPSRAVVFEATAAPELPPQVPFCGVEDDALRAVAALRAVGCDSGRAGSRGGLAPAGARGRHRLRVLSALRRCQ